jgi:hypothetical protein
LSNTTKLWLLTFGQSVAALETKLHDERGRRAFNYIYGRKLAIRCRTA